PRTQPDRPLTDFGGLPPTEKKKDQKQKQAVRPPFVEPSPRSASRTGRKAAEHGLGSTRASAARDPLLIFFFFSVGGEHL
ncbi:TPA: hypothetical protein ACKP7W_003607, partial [Stenotrophomonas maltophilia]